MSDEFVLEPFGVHDTKRLTVPSAEASLYTPQLIPQEGFWRVVDYLGGDRAIADAMTSGVGPVAVGGLETPELFDAARHMGALDGFNFSHLKLHVRMPIQSALFWVYRPDFSINELSARYSVLPKGGRGLAAEEIDNILSPAFAGLSKSVRSGIRDQAELLFSGARSSARGVYETLLAAGMARELARMTMGIGTHTEFYVSASAEQLLNAVYNAKALAGGHPLLRYLGPEAETLEAVIEAVCPQAVASFRRQKKGSLEGVRNVELNREALEEKPSGTLRYGIAQTKRVVVPTAEELLWIPNAYLGDGWVMPTGYMGSDNAVVQSARVSYGAGTTKPSEDRTLLRYLRRHVHTTPSEQVELQWEQCTPLFVWPRQGGRHRTIDKEGVLGAFVPLNAFYNIPDDEIRAQSSTNRQGRGEQLDESVVEIIQGGLAHILRTERFTYGELGRLGVPDYIRDALLGVGHFTRGTVKGDLHNVLHFLGLRNDSHAQKEIQVNAQLMEGFVAAVTPWSYEAFLDYQRNALRFTAPEQPFLERLLREGKTEVPHEWYEEAGWLRSGEGGKKVPNREAEELDGKLKRLRETKK
ncbi:MAG: FAD-dependent thymidylate synthase [Nanoarchaeota archaeon]